MPPDVPLTSYVTPRTPPRGFSQSRLRASSAAVPRAWVESPAAAVQKRCDRDNKMPPPPPSITSSIAPSLAGCCCCTREEWEAGALSPHKLEAILRQFELEGFAVVSGVFPHSALDSLVPRSDYQAAHFVASGKGPHVDNGLPRMAPWVDSSILVNPIIEQLVTAILGQGAFMRYWGGNCSLPATEEQVLLHLEDESSGIGGLGGLQGLHMDSNYPWSWTSAEDAVVGGQPWPHKTQRIFCNFGTHAMNPHTGSTEIWPGTVSGQTHQAFLLISLRVCMRART